MPQSSDQLHTFHLSSFSWYWIEVLYNNFLKLNKKHIGFLCSHLGAKINKSQIQPESRVARFSYQSLIIYPCSKPLIYCVCFFFLSTIGRNSYWKWHKYTSLDFETMQWLSQWKWLFLTDLWLLLFLLNIMVEGLNKRYNIKLQYCKSSSSRSIYS